MVAGKIGVDEVCSDCDLIYVSYAPMEETGWSMGILTPTSEVVEAADNTKDYFLEQFKILRIEIEDEYSRLSIIGAIFLLITLALLVTASNRLTKKFVKPVNEDWQYVQQEIQLEAGDTIFFYTDGVTEAANSDGKLYSLERLQEFLNEREKNSSAKKILDDIHESLQNFSVGAEQSDDITMLAIKFEGRK